MTSPYLFKRGIPRELTWWSWGSTGLSLPNSPPIPDHHPSPSHRLFSDGCFQQKNNNAIYPVWKPSRERWITVTLTKHGGFPPCTGSWPVLLPQGYQPRPAAAVRLPYKLALKHLLLPSQGGKTVKHRRLFKLEKIKNKNAEAMKSANIEGNAQDPPVLNILFWEMAKRNVVRGENWRRLWRPQSKHHRLFLGKALIHNQVGDLLFYLFIFHPPPQIQKEFCLLEELDNPDTVWRILIKNACWD